ncbi:hypothetical protein F2Q68_00038815 [Brassica cretica]|uniref:Uncharacterized protein n=2 Tax=Brassica cretica TaxID=69181 RepID=A0ABQ7ACJ6_BRACR|nr:hypothetical protein F2Q68_00038815 [Brassica cretica]KAF3495386.1 hypothetical protein DY000_02052383 [Brassica cretica]
MTEADEDRPARVGRPARTTQDNPAQVDQHGLDDPRGRPRTTKRGLGDPTSTRLALPKRLVAKGVKIAIRLVLHVCFSNIQPKRLDA